MKLPTYKELSKEQDTVNGLPLDGNWLVTGPPGTGKTVMAVYRANVLKNAKRDFRILTWSRLLYMYMQGALAEVDLDPSQLATFHSWFDGYYKSMFGERPPTSDGNAFDIDWEAVHRAIDAKGSVDTVAPDLLIDEGQDLPTGFYVFANELCEHLTVFADENQRISDTQSSLDEIRTYARIKDTFELRKNYRNSTPVAKLARHFYAGMPTGIPDLPKPKKPGRTPALRHFAKWDASLERIVRWARTHDDEQIGVFLPKAWIVKAWSGALEERLGDDIEVQRYHNPRYGAPPKVSFEGPGVLATYIGNSKGLEFDTVFVPELNQWWHKADDPLTRSMLYVLTSRARNHIEFHYSGKGTPALIQLFPDDKLIERSDD